MVGFAHPTVEGYYTVTENCFSLRFDSFLSV